MGDFQVFGIRHHGPGSARSLLAALDAYQPDAVLIEGPPDADALLKWVPQLRPPVALFAYEPSDPKNAAFWPFAVFSPEWQAMSWAAKAGVATHFMDLPAATMLNLKAESDSADDDSHEDSTSSEAESAADESLSADPFAILARMADIDDPERWWDEVVESVPEGDRFTSITEMMQQLRFADGAQEDSEDLLREAWMRSELRKAVKRYERVAVVCGAYHAPVLNEPWPTLKADAELLKGLPKTKCELAWVPWTHSRLAAASGYRAGVRSPGWYHHLFTTVDRPVVRWLTKTAATLRTHDLPVSSAHVIEATRLAETLAALHGRALPGLGEVSEATRAVMCEGSDLLLGFVHRELVVGEELGSVPPDAPLVPLEADLRANAKRLRLAFAAVEKELTLDLRKENERARSALLHRLEILEIPWGVPRQESSTGTFKEAWTLKWEPDFAVRLVEAATWGTSVEVAAAGKLHSGVENLAQASAAIEKALIADLNGVLDALLVTLDARAAAEGDVEQLLSSVPPLARSARYGNVRGTDTSALQAVAESVLVRACAGLAPAVAGLDEAAAQQLAKVFTDTQRSVGLLSEGVSHASLSSTPSDLVDASFADSLGPAEAAWYPALLEVADRHDAPPLLAGRAVRLLFDAGKLSSDEIATRLSRALSAGWSPPAQAGWVEGLLQGDALLLIHDRQLLQVLDEWVTTLEEDAFVDVLPLVRRTFGSYDLSERRYIEQQALGLGTGSATETQTELDLEFAAPVLQTVRLLLGLVSGDSTATPSASEPYVGTTALGRPHEATEVAQPQEVDHDD